MTLALTAQDKAKLFATGAIKSVEPSTAISALMRGKYQPSGARSRRAPQPFTPVEAIRADNKIPCKADKMAERRHNNARAERWKRLTADLLATMKAEGHRQITIFRRGKGQIRIIFS